MEILIIWTQGVAEEYCHLIFINENTTFHGKLGSCVLAEFIWGGIRQKMSGFMKVTVNYITYLWEGASYMSCLYRVSQEECARLREGVPYVKVYRYNPKHLCPKLNGYGDNGQRKVWSSGGSTHCTCQLTSLIDVYPWVWCPIMESQLTLAYSRLGPECAVSHVTSVLAFMCHV